MIFLKWSMRIIITFIILIVLLILFILTPPGLKMTAYITSKCIPGELHYQELSGSLLGPIHILKLSYEHNGESFKVNTLDINWKPSKLFEKKLVITQLKINNVTIIIPAQKPKIQQIANKETIEQTINKYINELKSLKPKPLTLPLTVQINDVNITNIKIGHAADKINTLIKSIRLNGTINSHTINLTASAALTEPQKITASIRAQGSLQHYTATVIVKNKRYRLTLYGVGNENKIAINIPKSSLLDGTAQGYINLTWYPQINWNVNLKLQRIDPRIFDHHLPSSITVNLKTQGKLAHGHPLFDLHTQLNAGQATAYIQAHHHKLWNIQWMLHIPHIQKLYPDAQGSLESQGSLKGKLIRPETQGSLKGSNIHALGIHIGSVKGAWQLYFDSTQHSSATLQLKKIDYNMHKIGQLNTKLTGNLAKHKLHGLLSMSDPNIRLETHTHSDGTRWIGTITQLSSTTHGFGTWKLHQPAQFEYSSQKAFLKPMCLYTNRKTFLCMQGHWQQNKPWNFSLKSKNFSFAEFEKKIMPAIHTTSRLTINADATGVGKTIEHATAHIVIYPGMLTNYVDNNVINTAVRKSTLDLLINKKIGLRTQVNFNFAVNDSLKIAAHIPDFTNYDTPFKDKQLHSTISILVHDFSIASIFEHTLKVSRGKFAGKFALNGTVGLPKLTGDATLYVPHFEYTMVKVHAFNIKAHLHVDGNKLTYGLIGRAFNNAPLYFSGDTTLLKPYAITHFYVHTKDAEAIKTDNIDVYATSQLKFLLTHNQLDIDGKINVPKATLAPLDFSSVTLMPVNQVTYSGLPKHIVAETSRKKILNLTLALGQHVFFKAYGAEANLKGKLDLNIDPKQGTVANGQVRIAHGQFKAYGQDLKIATGSSVSYHNNPVSNPYINARAYKHVTTDRLNTGMKLGNNLITVGIQVHGTINDMKFNLYSLPPGLPQADILSYLILGMAAGNSNAASLSLFFNTASGMIIPNSESNNNADESSIKKWFKSTQIHMHNETVLDVMANPVEAQSAFMLSNQLTNNLFVQYSLGVIIPESIFSIKYRLSKHWLIQSHAGSGYNVGVGADVLYTIED